MKTILTNGHKFRFYDDISELPVSQFHRYSKYVLVDSGIGDSIESIDQHITKIAEFMGRDMKKARQELLNLRQCLYLVATEQDLSHKSLMCLVASVDGKKWDDFSDSGIDELYRMANGERECVFIELRKEVCQRIDNDLKTYFPSIFDEAVEKNYLDLLRKRALLQLSHIIEGKDTTEEFEALTSDILRYSHPQSFMGEKNAEVEFDKKFEDMCLAMSEEYGGRVKGYSVMEFYSAYERMVKKNKKRK